LRKIDSGNMLYLDIKIQHAHTMSKQTAFENYYALEQLPIVRELIEKNEKLKRKNKELKRLISAISANLPLLGGNKKREVKKEDDENVPLDVDVVCVKSEGDDDADIVILPPPAKNNIVYEITESDDAIKLDVVEEVVQDEEEEEAVDEEKEEAVEEEEAEEEEEAVDEEEEEAEEEAVEEAAEEEETVEEEAEEEEAEEEEAVEEEEEEEAVEEEEAEEEEAVEEEEAEEEEEEVYEVVIKGKTYYTTNEKNGVIYGVDKNGDVSDEVGVYVDGKPTFKK